MSKNTEYYILAAVVALLVLVLMVPVGYTVYNKWQVKKYNYYYIRYYDWEAIDIIFEDPAVQVYFKNWGVLERKAKTQSPGSLDCIGQVMQWYKKWIRNFTSTEKTLLEYSVKYLRQKGGVHRDWKFVKIHGNLEFGYPFTLGEFIFIPHTWLEMATSASKNLDYTQFSTAVNRAIHTPHNSSKNDYVLKSFVYILAHERIHVHQRENPSIYKELHKTLGFVEVPQNKIVLDDWTNTVRVTNPDSYRNCTWLIQLRDQWYLPMLILDPRDKSDKPKGILIHVVQTKEGNWSPVSYLGNIVYYPISEFDEYVQRHYLSHGMYDPNEIVAYVAADLLTNHKIADTPGNKLIMDFVKKHKII
jgi:hypothetical protein